MEEGICQEDFRTYKERNWLRHTKSPRFIIYMLLAVSLLLSTIFLIVAVSKAVAISSELTELNAELPKKMVGPYFELFPCGPNARDWEYFNGKCYYFSLEKTIWTEAKNHCEDRASQLVVIETLAEQNFLQTQTRNERYWIGLTDRNKEGDWTWLDGRKGRIDFTYCMQEGAQYLLAQKYWKSGEPNDDDRGEDCAHIWFYGEWNDVYCTFPCNYICERPLQVTRPKH